MIDWTLWFLDILKGVIIGIPSFFVGMWIFNRYFLPKMAPKMTADSARAFRQIPEIDNLINRINNIMDKLGPLLEKLKTFDLEKIDTGTINDLLETLGSMAKDFQKRMEKPEIPGPD